GVEGDLLERRAQRELDDVRAGELLALERQTGDRGLRLDQGHAAAGDDALLDGRLGVTHGVLDAVLALLELDLGGRARPDDGDAAGELGEALLELLAVVVRVGVLDLGADLADPALDLALIARALDDRGLVLGHGDLAGLAQHGDVGGLEREADLLGDDLAAGEDRDVLQHGLAAVTEAGRLDGDGLEGAADLVDHERGQGLALDVLGEDEQALALADDLLQQRQQVLDRGDLAGDQQEVRVLEDRLLALRVGHEVLGDVALVEAHALGELEVQAEGLRLLDRDHALLADLVHRLGDELADGGVGRGDTGGRGDLLLGLDLRG